VQDTQIDVPEVNLPDPHLHLPTPHAGGHSSNHQPEDIHVPEEGSGYDETIGDRLPRIRPPVTHPEGARATPPLPARARGR
jgi:hypothetical protein